MENLLIVDQWSDELEFEQANKSGGDSDTIFVTISTIDGKGLVELKPDQARELRDWLINVVGIGSLAD